jgi:hypothetical protein
MVWLRTVAIVNLAVLSLSAASFESVSDNLINDIYGGCNQKTQNLCGATKVNCSGATSNQCDKKHDGYSCNNYQASGSGTANACLPTKDHVDCYMTTDGGGECTPSAVCNCSNGLSGWKCRKKRPGSNQKMVVQGTPHDTECPE